MLEYIHQEVGNDILEFTDVPNLDKAAFHAHAPIFDRYSHANDIITNIWLLLYKLQIPQLSHSKLL